MIVLEYGAISHPLGIMRLLIGPPVRSAKMSASPLLGDLFLKMAAGEADSRMYLYLGCLNLSFQKCLYTVICSVAFQRELIQQNDVFYRFNVVAYESVHEERSDQVLFRQRQCARDGYYRTLPSRLLPSVERQIKRETFFLYYLFLAFVTSRSTEM